ncbi:unnamed protein product [Orchesella dallaii]|uniref:Uncharacterized protein n=1 Tax=Orchesella dallaii TaxID=48710 RepID=A0ABP1RK63_9HEXA
MITKASSTLETPAKNQEHRHPRRTEENWKRFPQCQDIFRSSRKNKRDSSSKESRLRCSMEI